MARGKHKTVAVDPLGGGGIVAQEVTVEHGANFGGTERQAKVAGVAGSHGVHGKAASFVGGPGKVGGIIERHGPYP